MTFISDIRKEITEIETSHKKLREFAYLLAGALSLLAIFYIWKRGVEPLSLGMLLAGVLLALIGAVLPRALLPLYKIWMAFGIVMGFFVFRAFLTIVYFLAIVPMGIILNLAGRDPLELRFSKKQKSYWKKVTHPSDLSVPY